MKRRGTVGLTLGGVVTVATIFGISQADQTAITAVAAALSEYGLVGLLFVVLLGAGGVFLYWLASGKLYTSRQHDEIVGLHEERNNTQKETIRLQAATIGSLQEQNAELIQGGAITADLFQRADMILKEVRGDDPQQP